MESLEARKIYRFSFYTKEIAQPILVQFLLGSFGYKESSKEKSEYNSFPSDLSLLRIALRDKKFSE